MTYLDVWAEFAVRFDEGSQQLFQVCQTGTAAGAVCNSNNKTERTIDFQVKSSCERDQSAHRGCGR